MHVALYGKYKLAGPMTVTDQEVCHVRCTEGVVCSSEKQALSMPKILIVQYIIRSNMFSFGFSVCALNKLHSVVNSFLSVIALLNISPAPCHGTPYKSRLLILMETTAFWELKGS